MRIKQYISQGNVQGKGTAVHSLGGEKRTAATIPKTDQLTWQATGEVGNALIAIDKRMEEAKRVDEITNKQVQIGEEFSKLDSYMQSEEFLSTHKYDKYGEYRDEQAKAIKERIYGDLEDRKTIDAVDKMWGESNLRNKTRVKGHERKMQVEEGMADTYSNLTILKANFLRSSANADVRSADEAVQNAETLIAAKVSAGYFNKAQGFKLLNEFRESTTITMWQQNIETDPGMVKDELQKPQKNLPEDTRLQLLDQARTAYGKRKSDTITSRVYGDMINKYGTDYRGMAKDVMNPNKHKNLNLQERKYLNSTFNSMKNNQEADIKEYKAKGREDELESIYLSKNPLDKFKILKESKFLSAADKIKLEAQLTKPQVFETNAELKRKLTLNLYNGKITDKSYLDQFYGHGLDHEDHKELRGMLDKKVSKDPIMKAGMDTFNTLFGKEFAYDKDNGIEQTYFYKEAAQENALEYLIASRPKDAREANQIVASWFETQKEGGFNFNPTWWLGTDPWFNVGGEEISKAKKMAEEGVPIPSTDPLGRK